MRNYQKKRKNPYKLPHNLYMRMLYLVKDYERLKEEQGEITDDFKKLIAVSRETTAVEKALNIIPKEYRKGVMDNICYESRYPYTAHRNTYSYWRTRLLNGIAKNLDLI